jgi:hypothetical protein
MCAQDSKMATVRELGSSPVYRQNCDAIYLIADPKYANSPVDFNQSPRLRP